MDGKPLYEYARQNKPLPKPIEARDCTIYNLELTGFKMGTEHNWTGAKDELSQEEKDMMNKLESLVKNETANAEGTVEEDAGSAAVPAASTSASATEEATEEATEALSEKPAEGEQKVSFDICLSKY